MINNMLVLAETQDQFYQFGQRWLANGNNLGTRLFFWKECAFTGENRFDLLARTGTWFNIFNIVSILHRLESRNIPHWILDEIPIHIFSYARDDFFQFCAARRLLPSSRYVVFKDLDDHPEDLLDQDRDALYTFTNTRRQADLNPNGHPALAYPGPTTNELEDFQSFDWRNGMVRGRELWPSWLSPEEYTFLQQDFCMGVGRSACVQMLNLIQAGSSLWEFTMQGRLDLVTCYYAWKHRQRRQVAYEWAMSYMQLFELCGGAA